MQCRNKMINVYNRETFLGVKHCTHFTATIYTVNILFLEIYLAIQYKNLVTLFKVIFLNKLYLYKTTTRQTLFN